MPHSKDLRIGYGWYDINLSHFYEWLEEVADTAIEVSTDFLPFSEGELKYHRTALDDEIEFRANEFIDYRVFEVSRNPLDEDDMLPHSFPSINSYIHYHILRFCKNHASWYRVKRLTEPEPSIARRAEDTATAILDRVFANAPASYHNEPTATQRISKKQAAYELALSLMTPLTEDSPLQGGALLYVGQNSLRLLGIEKVTPKTIRFSSADVPRMVEKKADLFALKKRPFVLSQENYIKVVEALGFYDCNIYLP